MKGLKGTKAKCHYVSPYKVQEVKKERRKREVGSRRKNIKLEKVKLKS